MSDMEAYQLAYGCDIDKAHGNAWRLRADEGIRERIAEITSQITEKTQQRAILRKEEALQYLTSGVLTPIGDVDERSPLCQKVKKRVDGSVEYQMVDKLASVGLIAKMQGWITEKSEQHVKLSIFQASGASEKPVIDV